MVQYDPEKFINICDNNVNENGKISQRRWT